MSDGEATAAGRGAPMPDPLAPGSYRHWIEDRVRFADLDPLGHCNNGAINTFFESSRVALFEDMKRAGAVDPTLSVVIVRIEIDFRRELLYGASVRVGARLLGLGRTSMTLGGGLFAGEACAATAKVVALLFDVVRRRPVDLPASLREALDTFA